MTGLADRLRWAIGGLMWAAFVLGAPGVTTKGALVLAPSFAARWLAPGRSDALLTSGLAVDLGATAAGAYARWWWWDDVAHAVLPALLVPVAAAAIRRRRGCCPPAAAWLAVVAVAVAWELVELACDRCLGTDFNLGLGDSALDVACGALGAAVGVRALWTGAAAAPAPAPAVSAPPTVLGGRA